MAKDSICDHRRSRRYVNGRCRASHSPGAAIDNGIRRALSSNLYSPISNLQLAANLNKLRRCAILALAPEDERITTRRSTGHGNCQTTSPLRAPGG